MGTVCLFKELVQGFFDFLLKNFLSPLVANADRIGQR
jgi:hypothetical protein